MLSYSKSGQSFWLAIECVTVFDDEGNLINFVAIKRDITEKHAAELALIEAKTAAEAMVQAKTDFMTNLSHELRTPMNGIMGITQLLNETELDEEQSGYTDLLEKSGENLLVIIDKMLDFSKIETQSVDVQLKSTNIVSLVGDTVSEIEPDSIDKGLKISFQPSPDMVSNPSIQTDPELFRKIVSHLIENAIRFTEQGAIAVTLSDSLNSKGDRQLKLSVIDTGSGIPKEKLDYIFEPFTQVDVSLTRQYGGNGLGLAICQEMA